MNTEESHTNKMDQQQAHNIWMTAAERVKDQVTSPTLYRALELGIGITVDEDKFVLGFFSADLPMSTHLRSSQYTAIIERALSEVIGKRVGLRIIEGSTVEEYEEHKRVEETRSDKLTSISEQRAKEREIELVWDQVSEKITRGFARARNRQFAQVRGGYIKEAFGIINEAVNAMNYTDQSDDIHRRSLARVFEKLATVVNVPSAMLAYEFFKLRDEGKLK